MVKKKNIPQRIEDVRLLIYGTMHQPIVSEEMAKLGYSFKEMQKAQAMVDNVSKLQNEKSSKYASQYSASERYKEDQAAAWELYNYHTRSAKLAFRRDKMMRKQLQLDMPRKRSMAGWMEQARFFYGTLQQMPEQFGKIGVTAEELAQAQAMMEALADAHRHYKGLQGEAQMATQTRNIAMKELDAWVRRFNKAARLALHEHDQLLEGLGLLVRSKD